MPVPVAIQVCFGLAARQRATLYRFTAETGLNAKEVRPLCVADFGFGACLLTAVAAPGVVFFAGLQAAKGPGNMPEYWRAGSREAEAWGSRTPAQRAESSRDGRRAQDRGCADLPRVGVTAMRDTRRMSTKRSNGIPRLRLCIGRVLWK
jgi:hypothetical protein